MTRDEAIEIILKTGSGPPVGSPRYREFVEYVENSPECRQLYQEQRDLWETLDVWRPVEPSLDFDRQLLAKIEAAETARPSYSMIFTALQPSFAAGLAGLLIAAVTVVQQQPRAAVNPATGEESRVLEQIDRALADFEMLADFDVLPLASQDKGQS